MGQNIYFTECAIIYFIHLLNFFFSSETGKINLGFDYYFHLAQVLSKVLENADSFFVKEETVVKLISQLGRILNK